VSLFLLAVASAGCGNGGGQSTGAALPPQSGSPDVGFGASGVVRTNLGSQTWLQKSLVIQPDGRIVVLGSTGAAGTSALARLNSDGSPDPTYGNGGIATAPSQVSIRAIAGQTDGSVIAAGSFFNGTDNDALVLRFLADGRLDPSWGDRGALISAAGSYESLRAVAIQLDGKVVVAGSAGNNGDFDWLIARFNIDGTRDATFGVNGVAKTSFRALLGPDSDLFHFHATAYCLSLRPDGNIDVGGRYDEQPPLALSRVPSYGVVIRYSSVGAIDTTFGSGGYAISPVKDQTFNVVYDLALADDGSTYFNAGNALGRFTAAGSADALFAGSGLLDTGSWQVSPETRRAGS
jgi:uncharacterized delta-60 repeat protein